MRCSAAILRHILFIPLFMIALVGCTSKDYSAPGGPCAYTEFPGTATCVEITSDSSGPVAYFAFTPTDPTAPSRYRFPPSDNHLRMILDTGAPTQAWLTEHGIVVDKSLNCIRMEISAGTCTPLVFRLPSILEAHLQ